jgi:hypothetical protein
MRVPRTRGMALAAASLLCLAACGDDRHLPEPVTEIDVTDARSDEMRARNLDPSLIAPLATPPGPGRIIYDPPTSLANVAAADTLVRRANTSTTSPESPERIARDSAAARAASSQARRGGTAGPGAAPRDSGSRPERR